MHHHPSFYFFWCKAVVTLKWAVLCSQASCFVFPFLWINISSTWYDPHSHCRSSHPHPRTRQWKGKVQRSVFGKAVTHTFAKFFMQKSGKKTSDVLWFGAAKCWSAGHFHRSCEKEGREIPCRDWNFHRTWRPVHSAPGFSSSMMKAGVTPAVAPTCLESVRLFMVGPSLKKNGKSVRAQPSFLFKFWIHELETSMVLNL